MEENTENRKKRDFFKRHPFLGAVMLSEALGVLPALIIQVGSIGMRIAKGWSLGEIASELIGGILSGMTIYGGFMILPIVLTGTEIYLLITGRKDQKLHQKGRALDIACVVLGIFYSLIYLGTFEGVMFGEDWQEQLVNSQTHTPIYTRSQLTVAVIALIAVIGYFVVNYISLNKMPPLLLVLGMAAMYLGTIESIVWGIQVFRGEVFECYLLLVPLNCLMLTARTVGYKMWEWRRMVETEGSRWEQDRSGKGIFYACNHFLARSERWPLAAFLLMWPLLGILIGILFLFGQKPDAVIKAFTETSDWTLSQRVAPQNIYYDEHYLCTVAAGGHEKIVKPGRLGVRHGHQVIVNRQLCVANAFEQVLEERLPRLHKSVRHFYDTYGFPVAKLIRSRYTADVIYFLMKPLEWLFLIVLYLTDVNPEDRIAVQYTGKSLKDFE